MVPSTDIFTIFWIPNNCSSCVISSFVFWFCNCLFTRVALSTSSCTFSLSRLIRSDSIWILSLSSARAALSCVALTRCCSVSPFLSLIQDICSSFFSICNEAFLASRSRTWWYISSFVLPFRWAVDCGRVCELHGSWEDFKPGCLRAFLRGGSGNMHFWQIEMKYYTVYRQTYM